MKYIKTFDSSILADGAIIDAPFVGVIIDEEDENNNINVYKANESGDDEQYGIFINNSEIKYDKVPAIPMAYIYLLMLFLYPESPRFQEELYEIAINSYAGQLIDYGIIRYPNSEMKFNISDVDDFFNSVDDNGIAHKNNIFRHPIYYTFNEINNFSQYFGFNEYITTEMLIQSGTLDYINSSLEMALIGGSFGHGLFEYNFYKDNNTLFDFNSSPSMVFFNNINDILALVQQYYPDYVEYIQQIYALINNISTIRYIFVTITGQAAVANLLVYATFGWVTDNDTYFSFIPYIPK